MEMMKRERKEREQEEDESVYITGLFTAGVVVLMAGLRRALVVFLVEQWREWVFLLLNLVLLAIVFTSTSTKSGQETQENAKKDEVEIQMKKKAHFEEPKICQELNRKRRSCEGGGEGEVEGEHKLSKEELNERAEAFIAMFRQHLVSDARKGLLLSRTKQENKRAEYFVLEI
ncbi:uncharacterized protein LOC110820276 [Carica papaya]|uniref:uncharacterized protein LOC110820276 n=1 Tax=Carica papaya TaxID=3649 RepID=UPI000B8D14A8|nr:uncharacterized protein LOC110820276 [Carica papaya]